jgi:hypothetical protein
MKKAFQYILFGAGCILGTLVGIWLLKEYRGQIHRSVDYINDNHNKAVGQARSASLPGDTTTDAPPPIE